MSLKNYWQRRVDDERFVRDRWNHWQVTQFSTATVHIPKTDLVGDIYMSSFTISHPGKSTPACKLTTNDDPQAWLTPSAGITCPRCRDMYATKLTAQLKAQ